MRGSQANYLHYLLNGNTMNHQQRDLYRHLMVRYLARHVDAEMWETAADRARDDAIEVRFDD